MTHLLTALLIIAMPALTNAATTVVNNPFGGSSYTPTSSKPMPSVKTPKHRTVKPRAATQSANGSCANLPTTCYAMTSCAQAQQAFRCGNTRLDRDHDGIPCDKLCQ